MIPVDPTASWIVSSLLNAAGVVCALRALDGVVARRHRDVLWAVPAVGVSAWLVAAFTPHADVPRDAVRNVAAYLLFAVAAAAARRVWQRRAGSRAFTVAPTGIATGEGAAGLQAAVERFIASADAGDATALVGAYDPGFTCARVADEGGLVTLTREQMAAIWARATGAAAGTPAPGHEVPTRDTTIHFAEIVGDTGFVLLTRTKDLGSGWEPLFYALVWKAREGRWFLLREFVHQRTLPARL
jgi:hypothetical protein